MNKTTNQNVEDIVCKIEDASLNHNNNDILTAVATYLIGMIAAGAEKMGQPECIRVVGHHFNQMLNDGLEQARIRCEQKMRTEDE